MSHKVATTVDVLILGPAIDGRILLRDLSDPAGAREKMPYVRNIIEVMDQTEEPASPRTTRGCMVAACSVKQQSNRSMMLNIDRFQTRTVNSGLGQVMSFSETPSL